MALGLVDTLEFEGFSVVHAKTGEGAVSAVREHRPDCVILDLMLPDINGYQVCERVRAGNSAVPILMLTARSQEVDKIRGLSVGADDYVTKPFSVGELVARVRALLRRATRANVAQTAVIQIGDRVVDTAAQTIARGDEVEPLSFHEVAVLKLLATRRGEPVERDEILSSVWGSTTSTTRTVDNVIVRLRKKIEPGAEPTHILTVYGVGYKLV